LQAKFVRDVTIPDGTDMDPGEEFTKTWRLQNSGSCTWTDDFAIVFYDGDQLSEDDTINLDERVAPGENADISVDMVAPFAPGEYRSEWRLADESGVEFGLGNSAKSPFWVEIDVGEVDSGVVLNFAQAYCSAEWESSTGSLDCPGDEDDSDGFVIRLNNPKQENRNEDEPALWTQPADEEDGWIKGTFPAIEIRDDDHFLADVGCLADYDKCNVTFVLKYRVDGSRERTIDSWDEEYDGEVTRIDIDLSDWSGKEMEIILMVETNGESREDAAFWLNPHIVRD
jgi:hypothetical protein